MQVGSDEAWAFGALLKCKLELTNMVLGRLTKVFEFYTIMLDGDPYILVNCKACACLLCSILL